MSVQVQPTNEALGPVERDDKQLNKPQTPLIIGGLIVTAIIMVYLMVTQVAMQPVLLILGLLLGYTLFHARFGCFPSFSIRRKWAGGPGAHAHACCCRDVICAYFGVWCVIFWYWNIRVRFPSWG